jgi:hypothetical protein
MQDEYLTPNQQHIMAECDKARERVSSYTPEEREDLRKVFAQITVSPRYNAEADKYLHELYASVGAMTWEQKYHTLCLKMNVDPRDQSFSHNPTWQQKAAMMEHEVLSARGLITLTTV